MSDPIEPTTALAVRRTGPLGGYRPPPEKPEFSAIVTYANYLAKVPGFLPSHFFGQPFKVMAAILYGRDLGLSTFMSLQHLVPIEGKVGADAQLMGMLIRRAGHKLEDRTDEKSSLVRLTRADDGTIHEATFTWDDAIRAGLSTKDNWRHYPKAMLYARALTMVARKGAQDAIMGIAYTAEELDPDSAIDAEGYDGYQPISTPPNWRGSAIDLPPVDEAPGVSEATKDSPPAVAAIQPTPPAPPQGAQTEPTTPANGPATGNGGVAPASGATPAATPEATVTAPPATSTGSARSARPRRTNTVTVQPTPPAPAQPAEVSPPVSTSGGADEQAVGAAVSGEGAPSTPAEAPAPQPDPATTPPPPPAVQVTEGLTDDLTAPPPQAPEEEGKEKYLADMRMALREEAAILNLCRAKFKNRKAALEGGEMIPEPPKTPNAEADAKLQMSIEQWYPGRTIANLREGELENAIGLIQGLVQKIKDTGIAI